jgi:hypothetical protein
MSKATCEDINIDLKSYFSKSHISIPFLEFVKISSQRKKIKQILGLGEGKEESSDNTPIILKIVGKGGLNGGHDPFYISLQVNNLLLQNCLLDFWGINQCYSFENNATISPQGNKTIPEHLCHG